MYLKDGTNDMNQLSKRAMCMWSGGEFAFEDEFVEGRGAVDTDGGGEDLDESPAITGVVVDDLLVFLGEFSFNAEDVAAFTESDKLIFIFRWHNRLQGIVGLRAPLKIHSGLQAV